VNRQIYEEASQWLVELRVGDIDGAAREKLDAWFRASPEHIRAFLELSSVWEEGGDRDLDRAHSTDDLIALARVQSNVVRFAAAPADADTPSPVAQLPVQPPVSGPVAGTSQSTRPQYARRFAIAASVAGLGVLALAFYTFRPSTYTTGVGEQRTVNLPDGSRIELNARSEIRVSFSKGERDVELLAGQALFKVAKDASRPFVVASDATRVRAVGTQFDVYRKTSGTTVTVVEGRVAVLPGATDAPDSSGVGAAASASGPSLPSAVILLSAGEQVTVTASHADKPTRADVAAATAWTQRELVFDATPLTDVALEFNRYNVKPLIVSDERLKDFHVTGVFSSTNSASLLKFLRAQKDIAVEETDAAIRITRK
jgi:transmembrane sensor